MDEVTFYVIVGCVEFFCYVIEATVIDVVHVMCNPVYAIIPNTAPIGTLHVAPWLSFNHLVAKKKIDQCNDFKKQFSIFYVKKVLFTKTTLYKRLQLLLGHELLEFSMQFWQRFTSFPASIARRSLRICIRASLPRPSFLNLDAHAVGFSLCCFTPVHLWAAWAFF